MRERAGLSQRALATELGIHNTMVHRTEIGDRRIDPVEFAEWCKACGVDAGVMIKSLA